MFKKGQYKRAHWRRLGQQGYTQTSRSARAHPLSDVAEERPYGACL